MTNICRLCTKKGFEFLIDLGKQPVSHHFIEKHEVADAFPMALGQCQICGVAQLCDPMPVDSMIPKFDWIKFNEPEEHLKEMGHFICSLPNINKHTKILGISKHDKPLLQKLSELGFTKLDLLCAKKDLGLPKESPGEALLQSAFDSKRAKSIANERGLYEMILVRRVLEHAFNGSVFIEALKSLLVPGGFLVFEVPDCKSSFENGDVTTLWEEHISYFTQGSLESTLSHNRLQKVMTCVFEYSDENALVMAVHDTAEISKKSQKVLNNIENNRVQAFVKTLKQTKDQLQNFFENYASQGKKTAILGAGHRSCTYVNILEIGRYLEFFIDDDPNKHSLQIPGCSLPVRNSHSLIDEDISLCLLGINPCSEERFIKGQKLFEKKGGKFISILPKSSRAVQANLLSRLIA